MVTNTIYKKIKSVRELKNYTQEYMAEQLDLSQPAYNKLESGKTVLTYEKLEEIAHVLDVSPEAIIGFDSQVYFKAVGRPQKNHKECSLSGQEAVIIIQKLYEDKIMLLERLLFKTEQELEFYKNGDNCIYMGRKENQ